jgi:hypothetical protein
VVEEGFNDRLAAEASLYLKHSELPLECRKQVASGAFPQYGFRHNLPQALRAETGRILSRWGDAGWGRLVADDKHAGHFRDELVEAVREMTEERWQPEPSPEWVTCVPSHRIRRSFLILPNAWLNGWGFLSYPRFKRRVTTSRRNSSRTGSINAGTSMAPSK